MIIRIRNESVFAIALNTGTILLYFALRATGWLGPNGTCLGSAPCFCEVPQPELLLMEPWNSWSNFPVFFLSVAMGFAARRLRAGANQHLYRISLAFLYLFWIEAAGALFFHGSLSLYSEYFDGASVLCIHSTLIAIHFYRLGLINTGRFPLVIFICTLLSFAYRLIVKTSIDPPAFAMLLITLASISRLAYLHWKRGVAFAWGWLALALSTIFSAILVWEFSKTGSPLCLQGLPGHAYWHVAAGVGIYFYWLHIRNSGQLAKANA